MYTHKYPRAQHKCTCIIIHERVTSISTFIHTHIFLYIWHCINELKLILNTLYYWITFNKNIRNIRKTKLRISGHHALFNRDFHNNQILTLMLFTVNISTMSMLLICYNKMILRSNAIRCVHLELSNIKEWIWIWGNTLLNNMTIKRYGPSEETAMGK